ncbi:MAG: hypothetical protein CMH55_08405 [Myxococcales bacterium]|nr:hypothetical protein [Myxococcales bacterium]
MKREQQSAVTKAGVYVRSLCALLFLVSGCLTVSVEAREVELRRLEGNPVCALGQAPSEDPTAALTKAQVNLARKLNARLQTELRMVAKETDGKVSRETVEATTIRSDFRYAQFFVERVKYRACGGEGCETAVCLKRRPAREQIQQDLMAAQSQLDVSFRPFRDATISFSNLESSFDRLQKAWSRYRELAALQKVVAGPMAEVDVARLYRRYLVPAQEVRAEFQAMPFLVHVTDKGGAEVRRRVAGSVVAHLGRSSFTAQEAGRSCGRYQKRRAYHLLLETKMDCSVGFVGPTCTLHLSPAMTNCHQGQRYPLPPVRFQGLATTMEQASEKAMLQFELKGRAKLVGQILGKID